MLALGERVRWEAGGSVRSRLGKIYPRKKCSIFGGHKTGLPFQPLRRVKTAGMLQNHLFCSQLFDGREGLPNGVGGIDVRGFAISEAGVEGLVTQRLLNDEGVGS